MKKLVGLLVGAASDRKSGGSGAKGAVQGYVIESAVKLAVPRALAVGIAWGIQHVTRRGLQGLRRELQRQKAASAG